jgi:hypothetical protein
MSTKLLVSLAVASVFAALAACSSDDGKQLSGSQAPHGSAAPASPPPPPANAGPPVTDAGPGGGGQDANPPPNNYAKFHPAMPELLSSGGRVLTKPKFQAITFPNDPFRPQIEQFIDKIGASSYWSFIAREYGVMAGSALTPVHLTDPAPSNIDDADIKTWLRSKIDNHAPGFAPPDDNTLYTIFYPSGTTITLTGTTSCDYFGGYHEEVQLSSGKMVSYAVLPRCANFANLKGIDAVTFTASHELFEGVTDALPQTNPAYNHVDDEHFAWSYVFLPEGGDLCVQSQALGTRPSDLGFMVQRTWSNAWAKTGHHPCVPGDGSVYFNAAPVMPDAVTVNAYQGQMQVTTRGIRIPIGQSKTIDLQLFSDGPMANWEVLAIDWAGLQSGQQEELSFSLDKTSGNNGDTLKLTIQALRPAADGFSAFLIQSRSGAQVNYWAAAVAH